MTDEIELDYRPPPPDLAAFVSTFYRFATDRAVFEDVERADRAQLRFRLSAGPADYRFADGTVQPAPPLHVLGPTSGPVVTRVAGPVRVFGMGLTAAGWGALIGIEASAMLNRVLDARALFGARMADAAAELTRAPGIEAMVAAVVPLLRELVGACDTATLAFARTVDAWLTGMASPLIEDLAAAAGVSRRQVERRCNALYGCPPKLLARKYRALRAAVAIAAGADEAEALIAEGFYDQSHMIREIKQFTGLTPRQMRDQPGMLAQMTIARRRALEGHVPPIVSRT